MRTIFIGCVASLILGNVSIAQMPGVGAGAGGGVQRPGRGPGEQSGEDGAASVHEEKPEIAARKAYAAGVKSIDKAAEFETLASQTPNADKKARALEKVGDAYNRALDQFTEALRNKGDMVDAWSRVGYVHLRLEAYAESIDDYNHALALKSDLYDAIFHRGEANLAIDRLDEAKTAYLDLANHEHGLADKLLLSMRKWLAEHKVAARGMSVAAIDAFEQWLKSR